MLVAVFCVAVVFAGASWRLPGLGSVERLAYDFRQALTAPVIAQDPRILLVDYDEAAVAQTGRRSPFDRLLLAEAIRRLDGLGARVIGVDILFDSHIKGEDGALIKALGAAKTKIFVAAVPPSEAGNLLAPAQARAQAAFFSRLDPRAIGRASALVAYDPDGVMRHMPLAAADTLAGRLAMAAGVRAPLPDHPITFAQPRTEGERVFARLPILSIATMPAAYVASLGPLVKGRIVLIGAHLDDFDQHRTPLSIIDGDTVSGLDIIAFELRDLLQNNRAVAVSAQVVWLWAVVAAAAGLAAGWIRLGSALEVAAAALPIFGAILLSFGLQMTPGSTTYGLPVVGATLAFLMTLLVSGAVRRSLSVAERKMASEMAERYLPPAVAKMIEKRPELLEPYGRRTNIAVVFTDLVGFTSFSETLEPERLTRVLNDYLDGMSQIVLAHGGTLDKFIGDSVVCFWGAPIAAADDARRAIAAALAMQAFSTAYADGAAASGLPLGGTRIGVHFGEATVGNFGGKTRVQYTAMGDTMNLGSRLEGANTHLGTWVLASAEIVALATDVPARDMGWIAVKGRKAACHVFQLDMTLSAVDAAQHNDLLRRLRADAPEASLDLQRLVRRRPEDRALAGLERRAETVGWNGVFQLDSK